MASVSSTVADLHDLGIVHGRLGPSHILIGPNGRPIISGFGPSDRGPGDSRLTPLDDVAAIGEIIIDQLGSQRGGAPIPRSEENTSEPPSLMRTSYAAYCLKKKNKKTNT